MPLLARGENSALPVMGDMNPGDMNSACITAHVTRCSAQIGTGPLSSTEDDSAQFLLLKSNTGEHPDATPQWRSASFSMPNRSSR